MAGAFDIYMPEAGITGKIPVLVGLGFKAAVPAGHVALLLPRSSIGVKHGVDLTNTCGVIDPDYRGEWKASLHQKEGFPPFSWNRGDRLLQFLVVPVAQVTLNQVDKLSETTRGVGGFGSSGK